MAGSTNDIIECRSCGAVLTKDDLFCGECGAPRPGAEIDVPLEVSPEPRPEQGEGATESPLEEDKLEAVVETVPPPAQGTYRPIPAPARPKQAPRPTSPAEWWRIVAIIVTVLAVVAGCGLIALGVLVGFVIPDPDTGQVAAGTMVSAASWICFCPGALALIVAGVLWAVVLRKRRPGS